MNAPLGQTAPPSPTEFELALRTRLHRLADHAPTTVRAIDEIAVIGAHHRPRGDRRRVAGVGGTIAILAAAFGVTTLAVGSGETGGAASPEEAVVRLVQAIEDEDVLSVLDIVDPSEVGALRAAFDQAESDATRLALVDDSFRLDGIAGLDVAADGLVFATNDLTANLATVTATAGTLTTIIDPASFPLGDTLAESAGRAPWIGSVSLAGDDHGWATLATVRRDGRWYVSASFTIAEAARRSAGVDLPSAAAITPEGFDSPDAAAAGLFGRLLAGDLAGAIATAAPGEGDALALYASLWVPGVHAVVDEQVAAGWSLTLLEPTFEVRGEGDRRTVHPSSFVIAGTVPAAWASSSGRLDPDLDTVVWTSDGSGWVLVPAGEPMPPTLDGLELQEFAYTSSSDLNTAVEQPDGSIEPHLFLDDGDGGPISVRIDRRDGCTTLDAGARRVLPFDAPGTASQPASPDGSVRSCGTTSLLDAWLIARRSSAFDLPAIATVQIEGRWFVAPLGTVALSVTGLLSDVADADALFDGPLAGAIYGTSRDDLERRLLGMPIADVPSACAALVAVESGRVSAVAGTPTADQARACAGAVDGGWSAYAGEGSAPAPVADPGSPGAIEPAADSVPAATAPTAPGDEPVGG